MLKNPPTDLSAALAELTITIYAIRTNGLPAPSDCRKRIAAAFILAACSQLDCEGRFSEFRNKPGSPHGAERDWR